MNNLVEFKLKAMHIGITKSNTTLDFFKEKDGTTTIELEFDDSDQKNSVQMGLTNDELKDLIVKLQLFVD